MVGILSPEDLTGQEILIMLSKYYDLMKTLILSYTLEPAGSHGVWGLDDHFHLIYIVGACQLVDFKECFIGIESTDDSEVSTSSTTTMGHRGRSWEKIAKGMVKMYYGEVLCKFPVVQHFYFGNVFYPWVDEVSLKPLPESNPDEVTNSNDAGTGTGTTKDINHRSEAEIAMTTLYQKREADLAKLVSSRRPDHGVPSVTGAPWAPSSGSNTKTAVTGVPWATPSGSTAKTPVTGAPWASAGAKSQVTKAPWSRR
ncbi:unnamed protein product [Ambrosiozyma monospora]|uniref:Unnamed protein product n=1 Tax=Ambrosiozyma monospora TaxID=43982 RepID=A0ACB5SW79_AMBMO|nr:unnamed protein product [Ambrosiozyma monospora]